MPRALLTHVVCFLDTDVHTFTTPVLSAPVEWTGAVHAVMHMQLGKATDCDVIVRISDVYPDGRSMLIADYHRRATFREGLNLPPVALSPGEVCVVYILSRLRTHGPPRLGT